MIPAPVDRIQSKEGLFGSMVSKLKQTTRPSDTGTNNLLSADMQAEAYTDAPVL